MTTQDNDFPDDTPGQARLRMQRPPANGGVIPGRPSSLPGSLEQMQAFMQSASLGRPRISGVVFDEAAGNPADEIPAEVQTGETVLTDAELKAKAIKLMGPRPRVFYTETAIQNAMATAHDGREAGAPCPRCGAVLPNRCVPHASKRSYKWRLAATRKALTAAQAEIELMREALEINAVAATQLQVEKDEQKGRTTEIAMLKSELDSAVFHNGELRAQLEETAARVPYNPLDSKPGNRWIEPITGRRYIHTEFDETFRIYGGPQPQPGALLSLTGQSFADFWMFRSMVPLDVYEAALAEWETDQAKKAAALLAEDDEDGDDFNDY